MYEQLKNQLTLSLMGRFSTEDIAYIMGKLNIIANDYNITPKTSEVVVYDNHTAPHLLKLYLVCKKMEGLSEQTLYNYNRYLQIFFQMVQKEPREVTPNDIRVFLHKYQTTRQITNRTLDKVRTYIGSFFQWAVDEEYLERNPSKSIKTIKYEVKPRQSLNQMELEYLRMSCENLRERAILEFLYSTGCRISELANVKISDIDWKNKTVSLLGKGRKYRTSYINAKAEIFIKKYLETRTDTNEALFISTKKPYSQMHKAGLERIVKQIASRATQITKNVTPHIVRHTTATIALDNGMPIEDISKLLGHSNISTTMIYARVAAENVQIEHKKCVI